MNLSNGSDQSNYKLIITSMSENDWKNINFLNIID